MEINQAKIGVTWSGQYGELPDPVDFNANDDAIKQWATEAIRNGGIPGISEDSGVDLSNFVVDRFNANDSRPFPVIQVRPKTPFGL